MKTDLTPSRRSKTLRPPGSILKVTLCLLMAAMLFFHYGQDFSSPAVKKTADGAVLERSSHQQSDRQSSAYEADSDYEAEEQEMRVKPPRNLKDEQEQHSRTREELEETREVLVLKEEAFEQLQNELEQHRSDPVAAEEETHIRMAAQPHKRPSVLDTHNYQLLYPVALLSTVVLYPAALTVLDCRTLWTRSDYLISLMQGRCQL